MSETVATSHHTGDGGGEQEGSDGPGDPRDGEDAGHETAAKRPRATPAQVVPITLSKNEYGKGPPSVRSAYGGYSCPDQIQDPDGGEADDFRQVGPGGLTKGGGNKTETGETMQ